MLCSGSVCSVSIARNEKILTSKITKENVLIRVSFGVLIISLIGWAIANDITILLIVLFPFALASGALNSLINSSISIAADKKDLGGVLGLSASIGSMTRVVAPLVGGILIDIGGVHYPPLLCVLVSAYMFWYSFKL